MKIVVAMGERLGGLVRGSRPVYAVAPLFIPLLFATVDSRPARPATSPIAAIDLKPIDYAARAEEEPLPAHSACLPIASGDTLVSLFTAAGLEHREAVLLAADFGTSVDPRRLKPGETLRVHYDDANRVKALDLKLTGWGSVLARRSEAGFAIEAKPGQERVENVTVSATIDSSLYEAIRSTGETPALATQLVDVFQWDVDFFRLQPGDSFSLVTTRKFVGDDHVGYGPVVAAQFRHNGNLYEAFRYEQAGVGGYYTRTGTPTRKQFLRSPLKYTRITSGFTHRRFHPVLNRFRPHYGVDYGAPVGTPVMSTADGVVVFAGFNRGEGNYITVRHNSKTESSYLHLSRFAKGLRKGTKVRQGDVIGYVGSTGMSTGPHLDYRISESGKWIDPRGLKSIAADPLHGEALRRFKGEVARFVGQLDRAAQIATGASAPPRSQALF
jgi:murein DD-endopeptidase MepM/ murein hydrolase activator NlpD